jgi:hypothetical protein
MSEERRRILGMLANGKITAEEAERLLDALQEGAGEESGREPGAGKSPKCLVVKVEPKTRDGDSVNIRLPLNLLRAGMKLGALMPEHARDKVDEALEKKGINIDLKKAGGEEFETLVACLCETSIDVDDDKERVRICCE